MERKKRRSERGKMSEKVRTFRGRDNGTKKVR